MSVPKSLDPETPPLLAERILAVRAWDLLRMGGTEQQLLGSIAMSVVWPPGTPMRAECQAAEHKGDEVPSPTCTCGIYARHPHLIDYAEWIEAREMGEAVGVIEAWGRIELHETGLRAEAARVKALLVDPSASRHHCSELERAAHTYGAELVPITGEAHFDSYLREQVPGLDEDAIDFLLLGRQQVRLKLRGASFDRRDGGPVEGAGLLPEDQVREPSLWGLQTPTEVPGVEIYRVAGALHHEDALQAHCFEPGLSIDLVPEPDNPHDSNAIAIWDAERRFKVGYIPREAAPTVGQQLRRGRIRRAFSIWEWREAESDRRIGLHVLVSRTPAVVFAHTGLPLADPPMIMWD